MKFRFLHARLGLLESHTRIPFRYGIACMTHCPQATLELTAEVAGQRVQGYSGDCLPPLWFDKSPGKSFDQQIADMQLVIQQAATAFRDVFQVAGDFGGGWNQVYTSTLGWAMHQQLPCLLASFGVSMLERAALDAMLRASGLSFHEGVRRNLFDLPILTPTLGSYQFRDWLPAQPRSHVYVRHTVGLGDPLTRAQLTSEDDPADGFPVTLEEHLGVYGIRYLKIKVSNRLDHDLARLREIAALVQQFRGVDYQVTIDGNEQYQNAAELETLMAAIESDRHLQSLWANTLIIEQPLARSLALDRKSNMRAISARKPVIIDESDGDLSSFATAIHLGYRGVSTKNCKGPIKSLLNAGMIWRHNRDEKNRAVPLVMTAEDLCTVGIIPVQSDLCLVAALGLEHVERNGHHYHPGLSYLPRAEQEAALAAHGDLYQRSGDRIAPRIVDGQMQIGSLQCVGFGFAVLPDMRARQIVWEV